MILTPYEFDITRELISIALANAADSFSKMANEKILIEQYRLEILEKTQVDKLLDGTADDYFYVLTTEIKGKLTGKSYLLFNPADARKVFRLFTPGHETLDGGNLNDFQQAILLELDNIISAAMVTQLSNFLGLFTYGDVPRLEYLATGQVHENFRRDVRNYDVILSVHARLQSYKTNMSPTFTCFFTREFISAVKLLVETRKHLSLLKIGSNE
jgi:chemotaxis protein CheY-P-specific phosphatase CheC